MNNLSLLNNTPSLDIEPYMSLCNIIETTKMGLYA